MGTYENKYKEALERAKAMIKVAANQDEAIGFANTVFPELEESEDEKVEKAIFGMVYDSDNELWNSYGVSKSDVLAWLEKQGKQKSIDDLTPQEAMDIAVAKCFEQGEQNPVIEMKSAEENLGIDSETYNKVVDECIYGEQNPTWSEDDEEMYKRVEAAIDSYYAPFSRDAEEMRRSEKTISGSR